MVHFQWLLIRPYGVRVRPLGVCLFLATVAFFLFFSLTSSADTIDPLLQAFISEYNQKALNKSFQDNTYRGEAGILRIRPEVAVTFGMKVLMDSAYKIAKQKNENANRAYQNTL